MIERISGAENRPHVPVESATPAARSRRSLDDEERKANLERERKDTARISPEARALLESERPIERRETEE